MGFEFGIFDSFDLGHSTPGEVLGRRLDFAVAAEQAGIGHYHVTEHHGTPLSVCPSPNLFLAALSQRTSTMRIGALVNVLPAYHPLRLAEEIAILDQLTGGRLDMGVGSGVSPYELGYFGVDMAQAKAVYAEMLEAVTTALSTGVMRHEGTLVPSVDAELSVTPVQRPHPPLWYASSNTKAGAEAGAGAGAEAGAGPGEAVVPRIGMAARVYIGETDASALERFRKADDVYLRRLLKLWHDHGNHNPDAAFNTDAALAAGNSLAGSAETVRDQLAEQVRRAPVNYFEVTLAFGDLAAGETHASLSAFAETVMPAVREAAASR
jgi:alkanesulfonate monooxygenase SsuD/methylene tetrahydromethanopterin reductase-like flavin-dependent oxidoreductase (luciferase family)